MKQLSKLTKGLLGASALTILSTGTAFAQAADYTPADTTVSNTFTLNFNVNGAVQPEINNTASPETFKVDRLVDLTVDTLVPSTTVAPGEPDADLIFTVTNDGNDTQDYALSTVNETGDDFDTTSPTLTYYISDGDALFEPGGDDGAPTPYDPANPPSLAPDEQIIVVVEADIPMGLTDTQEADVTLIADTLDPVSHVALMADGDGNDIDLTENVLADGTSTANEVANAGDDSATATYIVAEADVTGVKNVSVFSEDGANCSDLGATATGGYAIPGACMEYTITVTNSDDRVATAIAIADTLPGDLIYVASGISGDFTAGSVTTEPAASADCGAVTCNVAVTGGELAAGDVTAQVGVLTIRTLLK